MTGAIIGVMGWTAFQLLCWFTPAWRKHWLEGGEYVDLGGELCYSEPMPAWGIIAFWPVGAIYFGGAGALIGCL